MKNKTTSVYFSSLFLIVMCLSPLFPVHLTPRRLTGTTQLTPYPQWAAITSRTALAGRFLAALWIKLKSTYDLMC
jgi:hypothetical protein